MPLKLSTTIDRENTPGTSDYWLKTGQEAAKKEYNDRITAENAHPYDRCTSYSPTNPDC